MGFPSLMGFGILVSGALLIGDLLERLWPRSTSRQDRRVASGAYEVVAAIASTAGRHLDRPSFLVGTFRSRTAYALWAAVSLAVAGAGWMGPMSAYRDASGVFAASPWMLGIAIGLASGFGLLTVLLVALALVHRSVPAWIRWLVERTPLGRVRVPIEFSRRADLMTKGGNS